LIVTPAGKKENSKHGEKEIKLESINNQANEFMHICRIEIPLPFYATGNGA
jgi:hypothetical protein